jgi:hypothetical protein
LHRIQTQQYFSKKSIHYSENEKIVVITVDIGSRFSQCMRHNLYSYCGRHRYDLIIVDEEYDFFDHFPCPWNLPSTNFAATRAALPHYDWIYTKQADTVFINQNVSVSSIAKRMPRNKHMAISAHWQGITNDVGVLWRNSPEGLDLIEKLIRLQVQMHGCAAAGMSAVMALILHEFNGTDDVFYYGDCEKSCEQVAHNYWALFNYQSLLICFDSWFKKFGARDWHVKNTDEFHGRIWIMPGSDNAVIKNGHPIVGDDISSFGNGPPQFHDTFFFPSNFYMNGKKLVKEPRFWDRFETTLALHMGGGASSPTSHELACDMISYFPTNFEPTQSSVLYDAIKTSWSMTISKDFQKTNKIPCRTEILC